MPLRGSRGGHDRTVLSGALAGPGECRSGSDAGAEALVPIAAIVRRPTSAPRLVAEAFATALAVIAVVWAGRLLWLIEQPWHLLARGREVPWLTGTALKGSGSPEPVFVSRPAILAPCPDRPEPDPMARTFVPTSRLP